MSARARRHAERIERNLAEQAVVLEAMRALSKQLDFGDVDADASEYAVERWDEWRGLLQDLQTLEHAYDLAVRTFDRARFGGAA